MKTPEALLRHRDTWRRKAILPALHRAWYEEIAACLKPGPTLRVGGGPGHLKEFAPAIICTDLVQAPWLDAVLDAHALPIADGALANIVLFDALHHLENVRVFFDEAVRALRPGGRIVVMDPYVSWLSWPVYRFLHPEPVDFTQDPLQPRAPQAEPFDANQAVATMLFESRYESFRRCYPQLAKTVHRRLAFFAYPLSGGFEHPSLLPLALVRPLLAFERMLGFLDRILAFRILVVLEKAA